MNSKADSLKTLFAAIAFAASVPATASVDADFMREMARTDGNPNGDYAIPTLSDYTLSRVEKAKHDAFIAELARSDGTVFEPQETESDTTVARR